MKRGDWGFCRECAYRKGIFTYRYYDRYEKKDDMMYYQECMRPGERVPHRLYAASPGVFSELGDRCFEPRTESGPELDFNFD